MYRSIILAVLILFFLSGPTKAQSDIVGARTDEILSAARQQLAKGEACLQSGDIECARREFDHAVDYILEQRIDTRSDPKLSAGTREIVERIYRYETQPIAGNSKAFWKTQEYEGHPAPDESEVADTGSEFPGGPLDPSEFQRRFAVLRNAFREKYDRDITLTGADHWEHRRLYGLGSAFDIRVRDLTREQVSFIIEKGNELGLRIKDFSTWGQVAAHNSRSARLGRPSDTYATGIHLHIDRMGATRLPRMIETPAVAKPNIRSSVPTNEKPVRATGEPGKN